MLVSLLRMRYLLAWKGLRRVLGCRRPHTLAARFRESRLTARMAT
jgi:hypothetical protein